MTHRVVMEGERRAVLPVNLNALAERSAGEGQLVDVACRMRCASTHTRQSERLTKQSERRPESAVATRLPQHSVHASEQALVDRGALVHARQLSRGVPSLAFPRSCVGVTLPASIRQRSTKQPGHQLFADRRPIHNMTSARPRTPRKLTQQDHACQRQRRITPTELVLRRTVFSRGNNGETGRAHDVNFQVRYAEWCGTHWGVGRTGTDALRG